MVRLSRIVIPNQPLHIMHRGNNRQDIFESEDDMVRIKDDIGLSLSKSECRLHLLITPKNKEQLAKFMQSMANRYARYFNLKPNSRGDDA